MSFRVRIKGTTKEYRAVPVWVHLGNLPERECWLTIPDGHIFDADAVEYVNPADDPANMTDEELSRRIREKK